MKNRLLNRWTIVLGLAIAGLVATAEERYQELQLFAKVLNLVQQYYVEEVDTKKLIYGGIKGMLRELDPHTNFLPPDIYKEFETETSGEFGGIGIEITVQNGVWTVISRLVDRLSRRESKRAIKSSISTAHRRRVSVLSRPRRK